VFPDAVPERRILDCTLATTRHCLLIVTAIVPQSTLSDIWRVIISSWLVHVPRRSKSWPAHWSVGYPRWPL